MTSPTAIHTTRLLGETKSASGARQFVREILARADLQRWTASAELGVSELVTNAVLHARTDIDVTVELGTDPPSVTVTVHDDSPDLPVPREWGETATTGRGLRLIAMSTVEHGAMSVPPHGKDVWFRIDDTVTEPDDLGMDEWDLDALLFDGDPDNDTPVTLAPGIPNAGTPNTETSVVAVSEPAVTLVVLLGVPVALWRAAQQHEEAVLREMYLLCSESTPSRLDLAGTALQSLTSAVTAAINYPEPPTPDQPVSVNATVTAVNPEPFTALQDVLDTANILAHNALLLNQPAYPEIVGLRNWMCEQVIAQLSGEPPTPWINRLTL